MRTSRMRMITMALLVIAYSTPAHSFTHVNNYETNIGNYRTCTDPLLETCSYAEILSPSLYYLPHGTKTSVIGKSDGTVQVRIDSGGVLHDAGVTYPCTDETFTCNGSTCTEGPKTGTGCTINRCIGGSNDGLFCDHASLCPGGSCTGGASCVAPTCQGGPRDNKECGGTQLACTNVANSTGWSVVMRGNYQWIENDSGNVRPHLLGDGPSGCMKVCDFSLNSSGAINGYTNTCSVSGDCSGLETFHHVEIRDPNGEVVGIPTIGNAVLPWDGAGGYLPGDPARVGDCSRASNAAYCP